MQMSTLDHESKEKRQRERQRVPTKNFNLTQALSSKTDNPTTNPIYLKDSSSHFEFETLGKEINPCSTKHIHAFNQTIFVELPRKYKHPNPKL